MNLKSLMILLIALMASMSVVADSDEQLKGLSETIGRFHPYGNFEWGDDYFSTLKKICEMDSIQSLSIDSSTWWVSDRLKSHLQEITTRYGMGDSDDYFIAKEVACNDNFFLRNAFPSRLYSKTRMIAASLEDGPLYFSPTLITITARAVNIAGINFNLIFSFGLSLPESYGFYISQRSNSPNESLLILSRSDWLPERSKGSSQPSTLASRYFGESLSACHKRTDSTVATMASVSASMGNEVDDASYKELTGTMNAVCNCTYDSIANSQFANQQGANEDFAIIETYIKKQQFSSAPSFIKDATRQLLQMKLTTGEQALHVYAASMQSCLSRIDGASDELPRVVWIDPLSKSDSEDSPSKVAFDTPLRTALPLVQIKLYEQGGTDVTKEEQEVAFQKINNSIVQKHDFLPSREGTGYCTNATGANKEVIQRDGTDAFIKKGLYYLKKPADETDIRQRNVKVNFCDRNKELPLTIYGYMHYSHPASRNSTRSSLTSPVYTDWFGYLSVIYNLPISYYEDWNKVYESTYPTQPKDASSGLDDL